MTLNTDAPDLISKTLPTTSNFVTDSSGCIHARWSHADAMARNTMVCHR